MLDFLDSSVVFSNFNNRFVFGFVLVLSLWAKSISIGVLLSGIYLNKKHPNIKLRTSIVLISLFSLLIALFTMFDNLNAIYQSYLIFKSPNLHSPITIALFSSLLTLPILIVMFFFVKSHLFSKFLIIAFLILVPMTFYSAFAISLSESSFYNLPMEFIHFSFNSFALGTSFLLFFVDKEELKFSIAKLLFSSLLILFFLYLSSYMFADMNSTEVAELMAPIKLQGEYFNLFWLTMSFAFIIPMFLIMLSLINQAVSILPLASLFVIFGILLMDYIHLVLL